MMKGRNLINLFGIPAWLFLIWKGDLFYSIFILLFMILALREFYSIVELNGAKPLRWIGLVSAVFIADYYYVQPAITPHQIIGFLILVFLLTCLWELFEKKENSILNIATTIAGIIYIPILLGTAIDLRQFDFLMETNISFTLVIAVWICDSAAFISGTMYGRKKIFPSVSPNKSWLGSFSGFIGALAVCILFFELGWLGSFFSFKDAIVIGIISGIFGQLGDFTESLFKRDAGIKDSGTILAGHGGVLDRFDSLIFTFSITYLYIHFIIA